MQPLLSPWSSSLLLLHYWESVCAGNWLIRAETVTLVVIVMAIDDWPLWENSATSIVAAVGALMRQRDLFCPSPTWTMTTNGTAAVAVADDYRSHYRDSHLLLLRSRLLLKIRFDHSPPRIDIPVQLQRIGGRLPAAVLE